jgi:signal transduction histidine kinase
LQLDAAQDQPPNGAPDLSAIQGSVSRALNEVRSISSGALLPQLADLSLEDTVRRALAAHERRTGSDVGLALGPLPAQAPLAVKITTYRVIQEVLNNAWRHAGGRDQAVDVRQDGAYLAVEIRDGGPGFDPSAVAGDHLGLAGMRERVESLGGRLTVESAPGSGSTVRARIPLEAEPAEFDWEAADV